MDQKASRVARLSVEARARLAAALDVDAEQDGRAQLVAYVVLRSNSGATAEELREHLGRTLPAPLVPAIVLLDRLPRTPSGKVDGRALRLIEPPETAQRPPRTATEELIATIWAGLLGRAAVGATESFFEIGGNSLSAAQAVARLHAAFDVDLPLREMFVQPTVESLARRIDQLRRRHRGAATFKVPTGVRPSEIAASASQRRLWFLEQLEPGLPHYHIPTVLRMRGVLDVRRLEHSLNAVIARHEALRTAFEACDGEPLLRVASDVHATVPVVDLRAATGKKAAEIARLAAAEVQRPFSLSVPPLLRALLVRKAHDDHVLIVTVHHLVADGWSVGVVLRELAAAYTSVMRGESITLDEPTLQYSDYARWQRAHLEGEAVAASVGFWKQALAGAPAALDLPADHGQSGRQSRRGRQVAIQIAPDEVALIDAVARQQRATRFMALLAAYGLVLSRYCGQGEVVIGSPVSCRDHVELEGLVGLVANMVALRVDVRGNPSFNALLERVRKMALDAYAHQDVPFDVVVDAIRPERDRRTNPIFQATLTLQNTPPLDIDIPGLEIELVDVEAGIAPFGLSLYLAETALGLRGVLVYDTNDWLPETATQFAGHFQTLLRAALSRPGAPLSEISFLNGDERAGLLQMGAARQLSMPTACLHELFEHQVRRVPGRTAVSAEGGTLTYDDLNRRANRLAHYLRGVGVAPESVVAVSLERSAELVVALLAVLKAGGAYLPIDTHFPEDRRAFLLEHSGATHLVTRGGARTADARCIVIDIDDASVFAGRETTPITDVGPHNLAYVIYTSGSTGRPKGVGVEHRNVTRLFSATQPEFAFTEHDVWCLFHSCAFDFSVWEMWGALAFGGALVIVPYATSRSPRAFHELIRRERVTVLNQTPSAFRQLMEADEFGEHRLESVRTIVFGGEALVPERLTPWIARYGDVRPSLINMYGITETTVHVTCRRIAASDVENAAGSRIGSPLSDLALYILDERLDPVPLGVAGEIFIGGAGVARGYLADAPLTAARFVPDPFGRTRGARLYRTGDRARWRPGGDIEFLGRADHQVKIRGFRIEPTEVEAILAAHPAIAQVAVTARADVHGEACLICYYVPADGTDVSAGALRAHAAARLPDYMVPSRFVPIAAMPLTPQGKVDIRALPGPDTTRPELEHAYVAPATDTERWLADIWRDLLGLDSVGREDAFFELGGHSLLAIRTVSRVRALCGVDLPVSAIFEDQTLRGVAARIDELTSNAAAACPAGIVLQGLPVEHLPPREHYALSPYQLPEWYFAQLEPNNPFYNVSNSDEVFTGDLDLEAFTDAWQALFDRHAVFRTYFDYVGGRPVQKIARRVTIRIQDIYLDRRDTPLDQVDAEMRRLIDVYSGTIFDFGRPPILALKIVEFPGKRFLLIFATHHILWDEVSTLTCARDLAELYNARRARRPPCLPPIDVEYVDFAAWANRAVEEGHLDDQRRYWLRQFAELPPALDLPTDSPRPATQTFNGATVSEFLPPQLYARVEAFLKMHGITLYILLMAVLNAFIHRLTGHSDFVVGTPIANRDDERLDNVLGMFATALPMRCRIEPGTTFATLVAHARQTAVEAYDNHMYPSILAIQELNPGADFSRSRLFSVMYGVQNNKTELMHRLKFDGVALSFLRSAPTPEFDRAKFDLSLVVDQFENEVILQLTHNTDLFRSSTAARMLSQYVRLLDQAIAAPGRRLDEYGLLSAIEERQVIAAGRGPQIEWPGGCFVHALFEAQAARTPEATALEWRDATLTYRELDAAANRVAGRLVRSGVYPEERIALLLDTSPAFVIAALGVLKAGAAFVPVDPSYPDARRRDVLQRTQARFVLDEEWLADVATGSDVLPHETTMRHARQLAYVLFTSGTTGVPKGIEIEHQGIANLVSSTQREYALNPGERVLFATSPIFDPWVLEVFWPLSVGATVVVAGVDVRRDVTALIDVIRSKRVSILQSVPIVLAALAEACAGTDHPELSSLRLVISGGAPLWREVCTRLRTQLGCRIVNHYGPTEVTVDASRFDCGTEVRSEIVPIGTPVANVRMHVLDTNLRHVPYNVVGELYVSSVGLARGYLGDPGETAARFIPDPFSGRRSERLYRTGDLARLRADGTFEYVGRLDRQVKIDGSRVEPAEIDSRLARHPAVLRSATLSQRDVAGHDRLVSYVELSPRVNLLRNGDRDYRMFTVAQRPELKSAMDALHDASWPEYLTHSTALQQFWPRMSTEFAHLQFAIVDEHDVVAGGGNAIPVPWDGTLNGLPRGWDDALARAFSTSDGERNTLVMLAGVVSPQARGTGLAATVLRAFKALARGQRLPRMIVPLRPTGKPVEPDLDFASYCARLREDGLPVDPWLRSHVRAQGRVLRTEVESQVVRASVSEWEEWTGQRFETSGPFDIRGGLQPLRIDLDRDEGVYADPCVWLEHNPEEGQTCSWEPLDALAIRDFLLPLLPCYMIPSRVVFVHTLPLTRSDKVDERRLRTGAFGRGADTRYLPPATPVEATLATIWQEVLGLDRVSVVADFYDVGGHSIRAVQMLNSVNVALNAALRLQDVFRHRTIRALARIIDERRGSRER